MEKLREFGVLFLTVPVILAVALLSGVGIASFFGFPLILSLIFGFVFAGLIEGSVYGKNIRTGIKRLSWLFGKRALKNRLIKRFHLFAKDEKNSAQLAVAEYIRLKGIVDDECKLKKDRLEAKRSLKAWEESIVDFILESDINSGLLSSSRQPHQLDDNTIEYLKQEIPKVKKERWLSLCFSWTAISSGLAFGLTTVSCLPAALATFSITLSATAAAIIWPVAIAILAVAYALLIYRTLVDLMHNSIVTTRCKILFDWIKNRRNDESASRHVLRALGSALLLTVGFLIVVGGACALAGTWWPCIQATFVYLAPHWAAIGAYLSPALAIVAGVTGFAFSLLSFFKMVNQFNAFFEKKSFKERLQSTYQKWKANNQERHNKENIFQRLNPFRAVTYLLSKVLMAVIFVLHVLAYAALGDRVVNNDGLMNRLINSLALFCGALVEGLDDAPYINTDKHNHGILETVIKFVFLTPIIAPVAFLSATWDFLFSQLNRFSCFQKQTIQGIEVKGSGVNLREPRSLAECFKTFCSYFQVHDHHHDHAHHHHHHANGSDDHHGNSSTAYVNGALNNGNVNQNQLSPQAIESSGDDANFKNTKGHLGCKEQRFFPQGGGGQREDSSWWQRVCCLR